MNGLHLLAELHDCRCEPALLRSPARLREVCRRACAAGGLTVVAEAFHGFGGDDGDGGQSGATGALVLAESHLAVHTWPEIGRSGAVTLDLYVCHYRRDNTKGAEHAYAVLIEAFAPTRVERRALRRADSEDQ